MGHCIAPYVCQRVTSGLAFVQRSRGWFLLNYVDDFVGAEVDHLAQAAFLLLGEILLSAGLQENTEKTVAPSPVMEFLGVTYNAVQGTIKVSPHCVEELLALLHQWKDKSHISWKELECLIRKLQFVAACVRPGRIFIARLFNTLWQMD